MSKEQSKEQKNDKPVTQVEKSDIELAKERADEIRKARKRQPWDGIRSRYPQFSKRPGYTSRWVSDKDGRIEMFLSRGWTFAKRAGFNDGETDLEKHPNRRIRIRAGSKEDHSDLYQYLMEVPDEIAAEDRKAKTEALDAREKFIREGKPDSNAGKDIPVEVAVSLDTNSFRPD